MTEGFDNQRAHGFSIEWGTWFVTPEDLSWWQRILIRVGLMRAPQPLHVPKPLNIEDLLIADARRMLPPGTPFQLRERIPFDYGMRRGMAWYYCPGIENDDKPIDSWVGGYRLVSREVA